MLVKETEHNAMLLKTEEERNRSCHTALKLWNGNDSMAIQQTLVDNYMTNTDIDKSKY